MVTRRVVIGKYADGVTHGLKVALPGFDALAEPDLSGNLSFNSNWTDMAQPLQLGFANGVTAGTIILGTNVFISDPGYVPYVESRLFSAGATINDDNLEGSPVRVGVGASYNVRSPLTLHLDIGSGETALYVTYSVPVVVS
ncbi:hypothetical protein [Bradyrhizobium sp. SZCCHNR1020]|uniref:hypothetical protein n=1 Tax=Bradyrhizobium sp. SZCCHNR1020 TaxID=3057343 RepID=UPI00291696B4|nr:hypothetical protein [Bradyrhizobium sp. SZCCHNR1020]